MYKCVPDHTGDKLTLGTIFPEEGDCSRQQRACKRRAMRLCKGVNEISPKPPTFVVCAPLAVENIDSERHPRWCAILAYWCVDYYQVRTRYS